MHLWSGLKTIFYYYFLTEIKPVEFNPVKHFSGKLLIKHTIRNAVMFYLLQNWIQWIIISSGWWHLMLTWSCWWWVYSTHLEFCPVFLGLVIFSFPFFVTQLFVLFLVLHVSYTLLNTLQSPILQMLYWLPLKLLLLPHS